MAKIWILHRDSRWRAALLRLLGESDVLAGDPCAPGGFGEAAPPDVVLLGLGGDFEAELEFVHRHMGRAGRAAWLVLAPPAELGRARQLFDALPAPVIPATSDPRELRRRMRSTLALRGTTSLGQRLRRGSLQDRFARWLAGLELDGLLEATDPARAALPVLVRGEPGTGRGLLVRYLHSVASGEPPGGLAVLRGAAGADAAALLAGLDWEVGPSPGTGPATLWLAEVDRLDGATQRQVCDWIEHGPPGPLAAPRIRWMATAGDDPARLDPHLDARLADALAGIELRLPPLRERPDFDELVHATIADWCRRHALRPRSFSHEALAALRDHPWPRNLPELDAVVARTLAATSEDPVPASALRFETPPASGGEAEARSEPKASEVHQDASAPATPPYAGTPASAGAAGARSEPKASEVHQDASAPATPPYAGTPASAGAAGARSEPQASEVHQAGEVQRLAASLAHEIGNPLVGIRTFSALLPEQYGDAEFRRRFAARLSDDTQRIEKAVETLSALAALGTPQPAAVDVSELISAELMRRRGEIEARRLIVLEELERERPHALADPTQLRFALHGLLGRTLALVPERGDLYVATHHRPQGPALRVVLRFRAGEEADGLGVLESSLWLTVAAAVIRAQGGSVTLDAGGDETLVLVELPAPAES